MLLYKQELGTPRAVRIHAPLVYDSYDIAF